LFNRPYGFDIYLVNVKTIRTIVQIFVAFSKMFTKIDFYMKYYLLLFLGNVKLRWQRQQKALLNIKSLVQTWAEVLTTILTTANRMNRKKPRKQNRAHVQWLWNSLVGKIGQKWTHRIFFIKVNLLSIDSAFF
jgi:hypothetical protein